LGKKAEIRIGLVKLDFHFIWTQSNQEEKKRNNTQKILLIGLDFKVSLDNKYLQQENKKILQKDCDDITYTEYMKISAYTIKEGKMA